jgi:hypothetical protein
MQVKNDNGGEKTPPPWKKPVNPASGRLELLPAEIIFGDLSRPFG